MNEAGRCNERKCNNCEKESWLCVHKGFIRMKHIWRPKRANLYGVFEIKPV